MIFIPSAVFRKTFMRMQNIIREYLTRVVETHKNQHEYLRGDYFQRIGPASRCKPAWACTVDTSIVWMQVMMQ
jgi:hypothetical protein